MRPRNLLTAVLAASALSLPFLTGSNAAAATATGVYDEYVALGDSWSADVVIADANGTPDTTYAPVGCGQSHTNYPKLLATELGISNFRDATCGGAETDDFYAPQSVEPGGTNPAQFDRLTPTTDLVTVGIGGNDAGIAGAAMDCFGLFPDDQTVPPGTAPEQVPTGGCKDKYAPEGGEDQLARQILEAEPKVVAALQEIHRLSPDARVLIIDYFAAVPEHACYPTVPISEEDMAYLPDGRPIEIAAVTQVRQRTFVLWRPSSKAAGSPLRRPKPVVRYCFQAKQPPRTILRWPNCYIWAGICRRRANGTTWRLNSMKTSSRPARI